MGRTGDTTRTIPGARVHKHVSGMLPKKKGLGTSGLAFGILNGFTQEKSHQKVEGGGHIRRGGGQSATGNHYHCQEKKSRPEAARD